MLKLQETLSQDITSILVSLSQESFITKSNPQITLYNFYYQMTFLSLDKFHCLITFINDNFFFNIKFSLLSLFFHFCMFLIHFIHLHQVSSLTSEMSRFTTHTVTNITSGAPCKAKNVTHAILTELPNFSLDGLSILHLTWNQ